MLLRRAPPRFAAGRHAANEISALVITQQATDGERNTPAFERRLDRKVEAERRRSGRLALGSSFGLGFVLCHGSLCRSAFDSSARCSSRRGGRPSSKRRWPRRRVFHLGLGSRLRLLLSLEMQLLTVGLVLGPVLALACSERASQNDDQGKGTKQSSSRRNAARQHHRRHTAKKPE